VLVYPTEPMNVVKLVENTGAGVGTTTWTNVKVVAPAPRKPGFVEAIVVVNGTEPLVIVEVGKGLQKGSTPLKQLVKPEVIVELMTPLAKQLLANESPKYPRAA
jgi:hypothetical protein